MSFWPARLLRNFKLYFTDAILSIAKSKLLSVRTGSGVFGSLDNGFLGILYMWYSKKFLNQKCFFLNYTCIYVIFELLVLILEENIFCEQKVSRVSVSHQTYALHVPICVPSLQLSWICFTLKFSLRSENSRSPYLRPRSFTHRPSIVFRFLWHTAKKLDELLGSSLCPLLPLSHF